MMTIPQWAKDVKASVKTAFQGGEGTVETLLVALLCRGHVLIEDVPGVGKTVLARAIAACVGGRFSQVQCTPDLLPADVLGVSVFNQATGDFEFREGPVMTNVLLVDEISRATPRTQSALLEAMAEGQVSVEGRSLPLPDPFLLIATESPVESEGTFPLPEVQKDRFFLSMGLGYHVAASHHREHAFHAPPRRDGAGSRGDAAPGSHRSREPAPSALHPGPCHAHACRHAADPGRVASRVPGPAQGSAGPCRHPRTGLRGGGGRERPRRAHPAKEDDREGRGSHARDEGRGLLDKVPVPPLGTEQ